MLSVQQALGLILAEARPKSPLRVPLADALGLILAEDVCSDVDSPPHDKAVVDGYAVRTADLAPGTVELSVIEEVTAGHVPRKSLVAGQATRVMTGAPIPAGCDAMVMIEQTELVDSAHGPRVRIGQRGVRPGQNIVRQGASLRRGAPVVCAGCGIRPIEIGALAEVGRSEVLAIPRPSVALLPTGNELVEMRSLPAAGQIRNSNGPMLWAAARRAGAEGLDLGIGRDDEAELERLATAGLRADILVISGGVSAGVLDLVPGVLERLGVERVLHKVNLKPGKPLWFGVLRAAASPRLVFGLPGNPVSSLVCFELFVRPAILRLAGHDDVAPRSQPVVLAGDFVHRGDRPTYHPARFLDAGGEPAVEPLAWQGSGDLATLVRADALAIFPAGEHAYRAGDRIEALRL